MKCCSCGKDILNVYYLDGKAYGYNCYKVALSLKYVEMEHKKNDEYNRHCVALINTFEVKQFNNSWNCDFKKSIMKQWNECGKLTGRQFDLIYKKLNSIEQAEYYLNLYMLTIPYTEKGITALKNTIYSTTCGHLEHFKNDERLYTLVKDYYCRRIERKGYKYYIVNYKDVDDIQSYWNIVEHKELQEMNNDIYTELLETICINN